MPIHKYHILHISQRCWHVLGEVWTSLQRVNVANWTRGWIRLLHICSGTSVMFVHQQKVNHIFNFSESTALPIHLYIVGGGPEKVMDWMHSSRYLHEHTQTLLHLRPPMEKKRRKKKRKVMYVFFRKDTWVKLNMPPFLSRFLRVKGIQEGEDNVSPLDNLLPFSGNSTWSRYGNGEWE